VCSFGNVKISFQILKDTTKFCLPEPLFAFLKGFCFMASAILAASGRGFVF